MIISGELKPDGPGQMDDIFEILVTSYSRATRPLGLDEDLSWRPATDAYTTDAEFIVQIDLAGMDPTGIEVLTDGDSLTIRGARSDIAPAGKKHYFKMEINVGPFARRLMIPVPVIAKSAVARYRNGFLYVTFRKGDRREKGRRRIDVDGGDK
ncbi:Hsp20/alpha crystallin family protein [bacterium]|nr:Hsp20/alpha crystallin family protein [bacterium]MBU1071686.1 Hsp20/alpha crystallin family protein [bacterium]MBU1675553.1 Hsp20/alpha crystallin family protein [bacterium]